MKKIFSNPDKIEKDAKQRFSIPDFLMMEHAAMGMADYIINNYKSVSSILVLAGKGNNGADGYALVRLLLEKSFTADFYVLSLASPSTVEAKAQYKMCEELSKVFRVEFIEKKALNEILNPEKSKNLLVLDCIFGTGFKGVFSDDVTEILQAVNKTECYKLACDIPSGLHADGSVCKNAFNADATVSMGCDKLCFYSDSAKAVCGKIIIKNLGIPENAFYGENEPAAFKIEKNDIKLPYRIYPNVHKGKFGHTAVLSGDKGGASILAAEAALYSGSGLTTIIEQPESELKKFKISPELMLSSSLPKKTTCIILGPGVSHFNPSANQIIEDYFNDGAEKHAAVFDAGVFDQKELIKKIEQYSKTDGNEIVFTPHLYELSRFCKIVKELYPDVSYTEDDINVENLSSLPEAKIRVGKEINRIFPNAALVMKSADTFIACKGKIYIITDGTQNLAKGGSGDVLCGMTGSLLSQGYNALDASITACESHALISKKYGKEAFDFSPVKFIEILRKEFE